MNDILKKRTTSLVLAIVLQLVSSASTYSQIHPFNQWYPLPGDSLRGMFGGHVREKVTLFTWVLKTGFLRAIMAEKVGALWVCQDVR